MALKLKGIDLIVISLPTEAVVADMERIFKPLAGRPHLTTLPDYDCVQVQGNPAGRGWRPLMLVAPTLVLLVSAVLAISYARQGQHSAPSAPVSTASQVSRPSIQPAATSPYITPVVAPPALSPPVALAGVFRLPMNLPRSAPDQSARLRARNLAHPPRPVDLVPRSILATRRSLTALRQSWAIAGTTARAASSRRGATGAQFSSVCSPESLDDRCIYQDVLSADTRLRLAYDRAERSGVSNWQLAGIDRRWSQAREHAQDDPDGTIRRYDQLAKMLDEKHRDIEP